jgi:hypothetical protein
MILIDSSGMMHSTLFLATQGGCLRLLKYLAHSDCAIAEVELHRPLGPRGVASEDRVDDFVVLSKRCSRAMLAGQFIEVQPVEWKCEPHGGLFEHRIPGDLVEQVVELLPGVGEITDSGVDSFVEAIATIAQALSIIRPMDVLRGESGSISFNRLSHLEGFANIAFGINAYRGTAVWGKLE